MTPVFNRPNKTLIMLPGKWLRIAKTPQSKIDNAEAVVLSALDRVLPFAYATVRPMYYLEYITTYPNGGGLEYITTYPNGGGYGVPVHEYKECMSMDTKAKSVMISNYYKLKRALRFLYNEGYVESYTDFLQIINPFPIPLV